MIYLNLLFTIVFTEMALIWSLMFRTPIRKLVIMGMDKLKQGKGPLIAKTVAVTVFVVFSSVLYGAMEIEKRSREGGGAVNPTDEVLMANLLLEASLMGFSLFLAMMTDRLHYYVKELYSAREDLENAIRLNKDHDDRKSIAMEETKETKDYPLKLKTKDRSY
ncbi:hypothetical protein Dsin_023165 [Dipteronia sinensis]|uniref:Endoplasmic reticulum transmembrane protein n=1 Tax=Dipteronia sinensis TaxID=43782 RepID=A0AAE0E0F2_9ROSI|nr:hypothetical protein Dsin_023165 [Dipteronia sinensis]